MAEVTADMRAVMAEAMEAIERGELSPPRIPWGWEQRRPNELTSEYLGRALEWAGLPDLARRAREGHFDDWEAPDEWADGFELVRLLSCLRRTVREDPAKAEVCAAIDNAVRNGEFDATKAEGDRWAASKAGQETMAALVGPEGENARDAFATMLSDLGKVGRNDPCPCGSGRKFKKCHGQ